MYCKYCGKPIIGSGDVCDDCLNKKAVEQPKEVDFFDEQPGKDTVIESEQTNNQEQPVFASEPVQQNESNGQNPNDGYFSNLNTDSAPQPKRKKRGFACSILSVVFSDIALGFLVYVLSCVFILNNSEAFQAYYQELCSSLGNTMVFTQQEAAQVLSQVISTMQVFGTIFCAVGILMAIIGFVGFKKNKDEGFTFKATLILSIIGAALATISLILMFI